MAIPPIIPLQKFARSNQGTCINQRPIVTGRQACGEAGQVIADGPPARGVRSRSAERLTIGFMTWGRLQLRRRHSAERTPRPQGTSSPPFILKSMRRNPRHQTRHGGNHPRYPECRRGHSKDLDENGIIRIGAEVTSGDYLVGKVTPKGETELTAEERLLRAIFGEKARSPRFPR